MLRAEVSVRLLWIVLLCVACGEGGGGAGDGDEPTTGVDACGDLANPLIACDDCTGSVVCEVDGREHTSTDCGSCQVELMNDLCAEADPRTESELVTQFSCWDATS